MEKPTIITAKIIHAEAYQKKNSYPSMVTLVMRDGNGEIWTVNKVFQPGNFDAATYLARIEKVLERRFDTLTGWIVRLCVDRKTREVHEMSDLIKSSWFNLHSDRTESRSPAAIARQDALVEHDRKGLQGAFSDTFIVARVKAQILYNRHISVRVEGKGLVDNLVLDCDFFGQRAAFFHDFIKSLMEAADVSSFEDVNGRYLRLHRNIEGDTIAIAPILEGYFHSWDWLKWTSRHIEGGRGVHI